MKLDSVPPVAVASDDVNVVLAAESVKVINAVWLLRRVAVEEVTVTVGETVLMASAREPAELLLPVASEKAPAATEMLAAPVNPTVGVNVAV